MKTFLNLQLKIKSLVCAAGLMGVFAFAGATEVRGRVVAVIDGNTMEIATDNNETYKVALFGIDSPELSQSYGSDAKQFMERLLLNKCVTVSLQGKDRIGNHLAIVTTNKKIDARVALLKEGLAWTAEKNPSADLENIKMSAQEEGKGLWKEKDPTPPWVYRRQQMMLTPKSS